MTIRRERPFDAFAEVLFGDTPIPERAPDEVAHQAFSQRMYRPYHLHGSSQCGFDEPCGAKTVRYASFVRDMTT